MRKISIQHRTSPMWIGLFSLLLMICGLSATEAAVVKSNVITATMAVHNKYMAANDVGGAPALIVDQAICLKTDGVSYQRTTFTQATPVLKDVQTTSTTVAICGKDDAYCDPASLTATNYQAGWSSTLQQTALTVSTTRTAITPKAYDVGLTTPSQNMISTIT